MAARTKLVLLDAGAVFAALEHEAWDALTRGYQVVIPRIVLDEIHYPWCETLSEDCDCHGAKGSMGEAVCSDFGSNDEADKRAGKSANAKHQHYVRTMEEGIARRDKARSQEKRQAQKRSPPADAAPIAAKPADHRVEAAGVSDLLRDPIIVVNRLVGGGFNCPIAGRGHPARR